MTSAETKKVRKNPKVLSLSERGMEVLKEMEGFKSHTYFDSAGHATIGYGHKLLAGEQYSDGVSEAKASELLRRDLSEAENTVRQHVRIGLTSSEFDALVLFAYNIGRQSFMGSTLLRLLNQDNRHEAAQEFMRWNKITRRGRKVTLPGLTNRRKREQSLFLHETY